MTPTLEAVLDELEADGLRCAGFGVEGGPDGAIVDLWPPVVIWLHTDRVELQADLGATPDENFDYEDAPDPPGDDWSSFDDDGQAWVHADADAIPESTGELTVRCRALASVASALLPEMADRWDASPPLDFDARVAHGP